MQRLSSISDMQDEMIEIQKKISATLKQIKDEIEL